jgi:hypothetical protein
MEREEMREIKVARAQPFVPTVAFNLLYEWGRDKVGADLQRPCGRPRTGKKPSEKMAPFRLDLGPRVLPFGRAAAERACPRRLRL